MIDIHEAIKRAFKIESKANYSRLICDLRVDSKWETPCIMTGDRGIIANMTHYGYMREDAQAFVLRANTYREALRVIKAAAAVKPSCSVISEECAACELEEALRAFTKAVEQHG